MTGQGDTAAVVAIAVHHHEETATDIDTDTEIENPVTTAAETKTEIDQNATNPHHRFPTPALKPPSPLKTMPSPRHQTQQTQLPHPNKNQTSIQRENSPR